MDKRSGEGSYEGTEQFDKAQAEFAKDAKKVKDKARAAAEALDGPEREELERAERDSAKGAGKA